MKIDVTDPKYDIGTAKFYKWTTPCSTYSEYLRHAAFIGKSLISHQHQGNITCFYFKLEQGMFVVYCEIKGGNEDIVMQNINSTLSCKPTQEEEFEHSNEDEDAIALMKYAAFNSISIQATFTVGQLAKLMSNKSVTKEEETILAELQMLGSDISDVALKIFGYSEEQIMFTYFEFMRDHFIKEITEKRKQGKI